MFFRRFLSKGSPRWLAPGPWSLNWILEFDRESRCHSTVNISNFLIIISQKGSASECSLLTLMSGSCRCYLLLMMMMSVRRAPGSTADWRGLETPERDSDNRGPRPGVRWTGRMRSGWPIRGQDQGAISQWEDSVAKLNNELYHIVKAKMWVRNDDRRTKRLSRISFRCCPCAVARNGVVPSAIFFSPKFRRKYEVKFRRKYFRLNLGEKKIADGTTLRERVNNTL